MAGSASNWFRPTAGPLAGQAIYISKANQISASNRGMSRSFTMALLNNSASHQHQVRGMIAASPRPTGTAKTKAPPPAGPGPTAPTGQTPYRQTGSGSVYQAPNGQFGVYNQQGQLVKTYGSKAGASRFLNTLGQPKSTPAQTSQAQAPSPTTAGRSSILTPATMDVVFGDRTYKAHDSAGSLAIIQGKSGKYSVVNLHTGKRLTRKDTLTDAQTHMQREAPKHQSHVQQSLDSNGRAIETIRPPKGLKHPGSDRNTLDDIMALSDSISEASKHVYTGGVSVGQRGRVPIRQGGARGDVFMSAIQQAYGFDALPQKVSKKDLNKMLKSGEISTKMIRGSGAMNKEFNDGPGFSSGETARLHGAGAYTASLGGPKNTSSRAAKGYSIGYSRGRGTRNVMGLRKGARTINTYDLGRDMQNWERRERAKLSTSDPNYQAKSDMIGALTSDKGYFATAMGYDAITAGYGSFEGIVVLNRTALVVQDTFE